MISSDVKPKEGDVVHYVSKLGEVSEFSPKKHVKATIVEIQGGQKTQCKLSINYQDEVVKFSTTIEGIPLALSRESGTWHPIGGYGCDG